MADFDFAARHLLLSQTQQTADRTQREVDEQLNRRALQLADAVEKYAEGKCAVEVSVHGAEVDITKLMSGMFLKINSIMTVKVDAEGTFAVQMGNYNPVAAANGQTGSLSETEMMDALLEWLEK